jgi:hypothetical protein
MGFLARGLWRLGRGYNRLLIVSFGTRHVERRRIIRIIEGWIAISGARTSVRALLIHGLAIKRIISIGLHSVYNG